MVGVRQAGQEMGSQLSVFTARAADLPHYNEDDDDDDDKTLQMFHN